MNRPYCTLKCDPERRSLISLKCQTSREEEETEEPVNIEQSQWINEVLCYAEHLFFFNNIVGKLNYAKLAISLHFPKSNNDQVYFWDVYTYNYIHTAII